MQTSKGKSPINYIAIGLGDILSWSFLIIVALMVYEVVARYFFNSPTIWAHEISGVLAAVSFIFGGAYCMAHKSHMRITSLADKMSPRFQSLSTAIGNVAGITYLSGLAYATAVMSNKTLFRFTPSGDWNPERSGTSWNTAAPSFIKFALFIGTAFFLVVLLANILNRQPDKMKDSK